MNAMRSVGFGSVLLSLGALCAITLPAQAEWSEYRLYNFPNASAGQPFGQLVLQNENNNLILYGTASGGPDGPGSGQVFELTHVKDFIWNKQAVVDFGSKDAPDSGANPWGGLLASNGVLLGTTYHGGPYKGNGTLYGIDMKRHGYLTFWTFGATWAAKNSGRNPVSEVVTNDSGIVFGVTQYGGGGCPGNGCGTVFGLYPAPKGFPPWTVKTIYSFSGGSDGSLPGAGLLISRSGALYGTTTVGGTAGCGTVFKLGHSGSKWTKQSIYSFQCGADGAFPKGVLVEDAHGTIYGTTSGLSTNNATCGNVFALSYRQGQWKPTILKSFSGTDGCNPTAGLTLAANGRLYGTTHSGGTAGNGTVFEFAPGMAEGSWTFSSVYSFKARPDGNNPGPGAVVLDANGNIYGTTVLGGSSGNGLVYELTPP